MYSTCCGTFNNDYIANLLLSLQLCKNFEKRSAFCKDTGKTIVPFFFDSHCTGIILTNDSNFVYIFLANHQVLCPFCRSVCPLVTSAYGREHLRHFAPPGKYGCTIMRGGYEWVCYQGWRCGLFPDYLQQSRYTKRRCCRPVLEAENASGSGGGGLLERLVSVAMDGGSSSHTVDSVHGSPLSTDLCIDESGWYVTL